MQAIQQEYTPARRIKTVVTTLLGVIVIAAVGGGALYYFKVPLMTREIKGLIPADAANCTDGNNLSAPGLSKSGTKDFSISQGQYSDFKNYDLATAQTGESKYDCADGVPGTAKIMIRLVL